MVRPANGKYFIVVRWSARPFLTTKGNKCRCPIKMNPYKNLSGKRFGKLTVIKYLYRNKTNYYWECLCDCGKIKNISRQNLKSGTATSCGCSRTAMLIKRGLDKRLKFSNTKISFNQVLYMYKRSAKKRKFEWSITNEQALVLFEQLCYYCNCKPLRKRQRLEYHKPFFFNGIDRIDSNIGYTTINCRTCCWKCNIMKSDLTEIQFYDHIKILYSNILKREQE